MKGWRYTTRMINGKRRKVKIKKKKFGGEIVRVQKHKNYSDRTR